MRGPLRSLRFGRVLSLLLLLLAPVPALSFAFPFAFALPSLPALPLAPHPHPHPHPHPSPVAPRASPPPARHAPALAARSQVRAGDFVCRTVGVCEPCPSGDTAPSCVLYGSRRPLLCISDSHLAATTSHLAASSPPLSPPTSDHGAHRPLVPPADKSPPSPPPLHMPKTDLEPLAPAPKLPGLDPDPEAIDDEDVKDLLRGDHVGRALERREEIRTWEACEKVVRKEREDFMEFILCNVVFAAISLSVLVARHRNLAIRQYSRLAARIGVVTV